MGKQGELLLKGPQVMRGYWNVPEQTAAAFTDGWFCTGDVAAVDAGDYTFIVGRKKDMIIAGGYNIYPDEIDAVLVAHPAVLEAGHSRHTRSQAGRNGQVVRRAAPRPARNGRRADRVLPPRARGLQGTPLLRIP